MLNTPESYATLRLTADRIMSVADLRKVHWAHNQQLGTALATGADTCITLLADRLERLGWQLSTHTFQNSTRLLVTGKAIVDATADVAEGGFIVVTCPACEQDFPAPADVADGIVDCAACPSQMHVTVSAPRDTDPTAPTARSEGVSN